jgi:hypothetical protein
METMTNDREEDVALWRTSDMALVAYLATLGKTHIRMELDRVNSPVSCYWVFEETDDMTDVVFNYLEGRGSVEPKGFNNIMSQLKNNMFDFLRLNGVSTNRR